MRCASTSSMITRPSVLRLLLMLTASLNWLPVAPEDLMRSLPAHLDHVSPGLSVVQPQPLDIWCSRRCYLILPSGWLVKHTEQQDSSWLKSAKPAGFRTCLQGR